ncbi:MAG: hypothetical protein QNL88_11915 [Acidobacteriota bacterium]|nr:hypothetical protein [Acidobacteriota bacterium]
MLSDSTIEMLVWLQLAVTLYLVGLIWCIQVVHYPLMSFVSRDRFVDFHTRHSIRISWIVILPMIVEFGTAVVLAWPGATALPRWMSLTGLALVLVVWTSTFALQVPRHRLLESGFDKDAHRDLVNSNWVRTAAWTLHGVLAIVFLAAI